MVQRFIFSIPKVCHTLNVLRHINRPEREKKILVPRNSPDHIAQCSYLQCILYVAVVGIQTTYVFTPQLILMYLLFSFTNIRYNNIIHAQFEITFMIRIACVLKTHFKRLSSLWVSMPAGLINRLFTISRTLIFFYSKFALKSSRSRHRYDVYCTSYICVVDKHYIGRLKNRSRNYGTVDKSK